MVGVLPSSDLRLWGKGSIDMRWMITFAASVCILWLAGLLARYPARRIAWPVLAYLLAEMLRHASAWLLLQRVPVESPEYANFYGYSSIPVLVTAVVVAALFAVDFGLSGVLLIVGSLMASGVVCGWLIWVLNRPLPAGPRWQFVIAFVLLYCGIVALLSLCHPSGPLQTTIKIGFAAYWLGMSGFLLAYVVAHMNPYLTWVIRQQWVTGFIAVVAMGWLIFKLSSGQMELSRQMSPEYQQVERTAVVSE